MQAPTILATEPLSVDEFLLTKAEARYWIQPEEADAVRAQIQATMAAQSTTTVQPQP